MNCKHCGAPIGDGDLFCNSCGQPVEKEPMNEADEPIITTQPEPQQPAQPIYEQPAQQPVYEQPVQEAQPVQQPVYEQPVQQAQPVQQPVYEQPVQQAQPVQQPTYEQPVSQAQPSQPAKKENKTGMYIAIAIIVVAIIAGIVACVAMLTGPNKGQTPEPVIGTETQSNTQQTQEVEKEVPTYKVNYNGFEFKIPSDVTYEKTDKYIAFTNDDGEWLIVLETIEMPFANFERNKSKFADILSEQGYEVENVQEKDYNDKNIITMEVSANSANFLFCIAEADENNTFGAYLYDVDEIINYDIIDELTPIIKTAKYKGATNNMSIENTTINSDVVKELGK